MPLPSRLHMTRRHTLPPPPPPRPGCSIYRMGFCHYAGLDSAPPPNASRLASAEPTQVHGKRSPHVDPSHTIRNAEMALAVGCA